MEYIRENAGVGMTSAQKEFVGQRFKQARDAQQAPIPGVDTPAYPDATAAADAQVLLQQEQAAARRQTIIRWAIGLGSVAIVGIATYFLVFRKKKGETASTALALRQRTENPRRLNASMDVANTIRDQIGGRALMMIGAKDLLGTSDSLRFRVGRNAKGVTHITVKLDPSDTYTVTFSKVGKGYKITTVAEVDDVYVEQLRSVIEQHTGLYTRLNPKGQRAKAEVKAKSSSGRQGDFPTPQVKKTIRRARRRVGKQETIE